MATISLSARAGSPRSDYAPVLFAVAMLLISMVSYQCGAALAKQLFPLIGAQGATACRLGLGALILLLVRRPWRSPRRGRDVRALWGYGLSSWEERRVGQECVSTCRSGWWELH